MSGVATREIQKNHLFDTEALHSKSYSIINSAMIHFPFLLLFAIEYCRERGLLCSDSRSFQVTQFTFGQSNPTFKISVTVGVNGCFFKKKSRSSFWVILFLFVYFVIFLDVREFVMRKKPPGKLLARFFEKRDLFYSY